MLGTVQASPSREIGPAVLATRVANDDGILRVRTRGATAAVKSEYKGQRVKVTGTELVCYCWPKMACEWNSPRPTRRQVGHLRRRRSVADPALWRDQKEGSTRTRSTPSRCNPPSSVGRRWGHEEEDLDLIRRAAPELLDDGSTIREQVRAGLARSCSSAYISNGWSSRTNRQCGLVHVAHRTSAWSSTQQSNSVLTRPGHHQLPRHRLPPPLTKATAGHSALRVGMLS